MKTFPVGIKEAFDVLMETFGDSHSYYGISWMGEEESIQYYSAVSVPAAGAAGAQHYGQLKIAKGEYRTRTIFNWLSKTASVKDVFHELIGSCPDRERPCIEWYKSDEEMFCMIIVV